MDYRKIELRQEFRVEAVVSVHYFEYMNDFNFPGERHDFWEILCVDKGEITVTAQDTEITLRKGQLIFHKPNEFHNVRANGVIAPNLVVMSFCCCSPAMSFFENRIVTVGEAEKNLLASIITEARQAFSSRLDDPYLTELKRRQDQGFGSEQMIGLYLEHLLIQLYRRYNTLAPGPQVHRENPQKKDGETYQRILEYLDANITRQLTIEKICHDNLTGRSQLQKLFQSRNGCGIIDYFSRLKIKAAKQLIREQQMNFTQIADALGYTSIHYFSRQFKKITGMTPTEYASSIKVLKKKKKDIL